MATGEIPAASVTSDFPVSRDFLLHPSPILPAGTGVQFLSDVETGRATPALLRPLHSCGLSWREGTESSLRPWPWRQVARAVAERMNCYDKNNNN